MDTEIDICFPKFWSRKWGMSQEDTRGQNSFSFNYFYSGYIIQQLFKFHFEMLDPPEIPAWHFWWDLLSSPLYIYKIFYLSADRERRHGEQCSHSLLKDIIGQQVSDSKIEEAETPQKMWPNNMRVLITKQIAREVSNCSSSWHTQAPRPALGKSSGSHSYMASFRWLWRLHFNLCLAPELQGGLLTVALDGAGKIKAVTGWMLLPSGFLCFLVCQAGLADGGGWPSKGAVLLNSCQASGHCHQCLIQALSPSASVPLLWNENSMTLLQQQMKIKT